MMHAEKKSDLFIQIRIRMIFIEIVGIIMNRTAPDCAVMEQADNASAKVYTLNP